MQTSKAQMLKGASDYIRKEVVPHIPDKGVRIMLETLAVMVEMQPEAVNKILQHPIVGIVLQEKDGMYDLDALESALTKAVEMHGGLELTIPAIPLISPSEKHMSFTAEDIKKLKKYMEGVDVWNANNI